MPRPKGTGKPAGEKYVVKSFSLPPEVWAEVEAWVPVRERSRLVAECLKRAAAKARREKEERKS
jgi:hypothetical protein